MLGAKKFFISMLSTTSNDRKMKGASVFSDSVLLPGTREEIFDFFSQAANLQDITPAWLHFEILTPSPVLMRVGTLIDYRLRVHGFPWRWQTEITVWEPPARFVDEQKRGPYRLWVHEHRFEGRPGGTLMTDTVHYRAPGGRLVHWLFVRRDVERIFKFRRERMLARFSTHDAAQE